MLRNLIFVTLFSLASCVDDNQNYSPRDNQRINPLQAEEKNILSRMKAISSEITNAQQLQWKHYYVYKNVDTIEHADVVIFGDRHSSSDALFDFIVFGHIWYPVAIVLRSS